MNGASQQSLHSSNQVKYKKMAEATGSDILSYRGDPGLAAGAGSGLMPLQADPMSGMNSSIDRIQDLHAKEKYLEYQDKLKSQEDLARMLAETGGSVFNMKGAGGQNASFQPLPDDQKILTEKAHDLRRMVLENPDNYQFNESWLDKKKEYDNLVNHAGVRATAYSSYNQDAAKTNDPDERQSILDMRRAELEERRLNDFHMPEPHLPGLQTIDPITAKDWSDKKKLQEFGTKIVQRTGPNGTPVDFEVNVIGIPNSEILAPMTDVSSKGLEYIKNASAGFYRMPQAKDPAFIERMNQDINKKAAERGIRPVYAATVDNNGRINYNPNPREVATALNIEKHGFTQQEEKVSKAVTDQRAAAQSIDNIRSEIKNRDENIALGWARLAAEAKKEGKTTTEGLKQQQSQKAAKAAYDETKKVFDNSFNGKPKLTKAYPQFWRNNGIDPDEYDFYPEVTQKAADAMIGIPHSDKSVKTGPTDNQTIEKSTIASEIPGRVVPIENKKTGEKKLVFFGKSTEGDPDGKNKIIAIVDEKNAAVNKLKHEANYDSKVYGDQTVWVNEVYDNPNQQTPNQQPAAQPTFTPKYNGAEVQIKSDGGVPKALVGGVWRKIVGKNSKTGEIKVQ